MTLTPRNRQEKRGLSQEYFKLRKLASFFKGRQLCFQLNTLGVVKIDVIINE